MTKHVVLSQYFIEDLIKAYEAAHKYREMMETQPIGDSIYLEPTLEIRGQKMGDVIGSVVFADGQVNLLLPLDTLTDTSAYVMDEFPEYFEDFEVDDSDGTLVQKES